jgi:hypothetical protein
MIQFPKTPPLSIVLGAKPSTHQLLENIACPNHNSLLTGEWLDIIWTIYIMK